MKWMKSVVTAAVLGVAAVSMLTVVNKLAADGPGDDDRDESRIRKGYEVTPVHLNLKGKNRDLVGLGSYIINAQGSCNDCHTCPSYLQGHNPYMGEKEKINVDHYLAGGVPFGPFTSRNITPEASGLPAGLTLEQFKLVIRTGVDLDHEHPQFGPLLQVMPWPVLGNMNDRDLHEVYEYLSAIPHTDMPPTGSCSNAGE